MDLPQATNVSCLANMTTKTATLFSEYFVLQVPVQEVPTTFPFARAPEWWKGDWEAVQCPQKEKAELVGLVQRKAATEDLPELIKLQSDNHEAEILGTVYDFVKTNLSGAFRLQPGVRDDGELQNVLVYDNDVLRGVVAPYT
jgi:hypothetical protein